MPFKGFNSYVVTNTYRGFYMILLSTGYWLGTHLLKSRVEIDAIIATKKTYRIELDIQMAQVEDLYAEPLA
jgi:hypothetical protein